MLTCINWQTLSQTEKEEVLSRPGQLDNSLRNKVGNIITAVHERGDAALLEFTREFDGWDLNSLLVPAQEINNAQISIQALTALTTAIGTITRYHEAIKPKTTTVVTFPGVTIQRIYRPIEKVGLYIPGGATPLVSSLLMQAIPAKVAGCPLRLMCTPVNAQGKIDPHLLVAARLCDIETIYPLGGAQAIAAMAYGTESVMKVDKIFGPGNAFVTEAKTQVAQQSKGASIDMPAGPSEVMILADNQANPLFVAADLLAQAEHGKDSQVILICDSEAFAQRVQSSIVAQYSRLRRQSILQESLEHSKIIICEAREVQFSMVNAYAPEHLIIQRADAEDCLKHILSAGSIFIGPWAAETMGDYVSGSNHVLPTNGHARQVSGLSTNDFLKAISVQLINKEGLKDLGPTAITLAELEGLDAHANAISVRLNALESINEYF